MQRPFAGYAPFGEWLGGRASRDVEDNSAACALSLRADLPTPVETRRIHEDEIRPPRAHSDAETTVLALRECEAEHLRAERRGSRRILSHDLDAAQGAGTIGMADEIRQPDGLARQMLAGEEAHTGRRWLERPLEDAKPRLSHAAAAQFDWPAEFRCPCWSCP